MVHTPKVIRRLGTSASFRKLKDENCKSKIENLQFLLTLDSFASAGAQHGRCRLAPAAAKDSDAAPFAHFDSVAHFAVELREVIVHRPQREDDDDPQHRAA